MLFSMESRSIRINGGSVKTDILYSCLNENSAGVSRAKCFKRRTQQTQLVQKFATFLHQETVIHLLINSPQFFIFFGLFFDAKLAQSLQGQKKKYRQKMCLTLEKF